MHPKFREFLDELGLSKDGEVVIWTNTEYEWHLLRAKLVMLIPKAEWASCVSTYTQLMIEDAWNNKIRLMRPERALYR